MRHYILKETPVPVDLITWAKWMQTGDTRVARDVVGNIEISTVFLGLDHSFGHGPPLLYETMLFGDTTDNEMTRCSTYAQALEMHRAMVRHVQRIVLHTKNVIVQASDK